MRRALLAVAILAVPASTVTLAFSSPVWAKGTKPEASIVCKVVSGSISGGITASKCNGNTGGATEVLSASALESGGTIDWVNGKTTTIAAPTITPAHSSKCKGTTEKFSATVTGDTTGLKTLGTTSGEICLSSTNTITAVTPLKTT